MKLFYCFVLILSFFKVFYCYTNFTGIEICSLYKNYSSVYGNYGEMNVPSPENYPGARYGILGTYNKKTNILWIFGGWGFGESSGMK